MAKKKGKEGKPQDRKESGTVKQEELKKSGEGTREEKKDVEGKPEEQNKDRNGKQDKGKERDLNKNQSSSFSEGGSLVLEEHPFKRNQMVSALTLIFIVFVSFIACSFIDNYLMFPFAILFFIISMLSFFFPSRYAFTDRDITIDRILFKKSYLWERFRGYQWEKNGLYLSPNADCQRFDRFRGIFLVMGKENREKLAPLIKEKIAPVKEAEVKPEAPLN